MGGCWGRRHCRAGKRYGGATVGVSELGSMLGATGACVWLVCDQCCGSEVTALRGSTKEVEFCLPQFAPPWHDGRWGTAGSNLDYC